NLTPDSVVGEWSGIHLVVGRSGFVSGSVVLFNGTAVPTTFSSANGLDVNVPANLLVTAGPVPIEVRNPDNATSGIWTFYIQTGPDRKSVVSGKVVAVWAGLLLG